MNEYQMQVFGVVQNDCYKPTCKYDPLRKVHTYDRMTTIKLLSPDDCEEIIKDCRKCGIETILATAPKEKGN